MALSSSKFAQQLMPGLNAIFSEEYAKTLNEGFEMTGLHDPIEEEGGDYTEGYDDPFYGVIPSPKGSGRPVQYLKQYEDTTKIKDWSKIGYVRFSEEALEDGVVAKALFDVGCPVTCVPAYDHNSLTMLVLIYHPKLPIAGDKIPLYDAHITPTLQYGPYEMDIHNEESRQHNVRFKLI